MLPTCKFFRSEQGCKFGNKCRHKHSDQFSQPVSATSHSHFQHDHASVRRNASFQEVSPQTGRTGYFYPSQNGTTVSLHRASSSTSFVSTDYSQSSDHYECAVESELASVNLEEKFQGLKTTNNEEGRVNSHHPDPQRPSKKICHYYARNGYCCFGSNCRFAHIRQNAAPPRFQKTRLHAAASGQDGRVANQFSATEETTENQADGLRGPGNRFNSYARPEWFADQIREPANTRSNERSADNYRGLSACGSQQDEVKRPSHKASNPRPDRICQFYLQGRCYKGRRCRFLHPRRKKDQSGDEAGQEGEDGNPHVEGSADDSSQENITIANCTSGDGEHGKKVEETDNTPLQNIGRETPQPTSVGNSARQMKSVQARLPYMPQGIKKYRRDEIEDVEASRLRRSEIDQLVKRFPKNKVKVNRDCAEFFQCLINFSPTDPDWPFDVKIFQLQVDIPSDYPLEMLTISLPEEQDLPETVRRYLEVSIEEWLEEKERELRDKGQVELVFRTFLRWLDRTIEETVTEALKQLKRELVARASGLEFISAKQLQRQYPGQSASNHQDDGEDEEDDYTDEEEDEDDDSTDGSEDEEDSSSDYYNEESGEEGDRNGDGKNSKEDGGKSTRKTRLDRVKDMLVEPERKGTEVLLKSLQLRDSAATMYFDKVCMVVQCERCKFPSEFTTCGGRVNVIQCGKCSQTQMCTFRPAMVHQFSPVMGYLDLDACVPFDIILQNCSVVVSCLNCAKETRPGSLVAGTALDYWCRACHQKLRVCADGVRFTQLEPSNTLQSLRGAVKVVVPTRKKIPKDPAIQEGKPLPNFGTCKHYKKSYRWLRFPCCGKVYPCDICHDSKEDHEMKFANRMICGFCCREQVFAADRPCKGCDMNMTRVHTTHWEGGAGCRDKITMCRNDKAKHRNQAKTVSKHSQKVKDMQSKKKTKLRHA